MKNTLLSVALTFCFLHLATIADAQRDRSFFKDSARYNAYESAISFGQSLKNLKKDSTYIVNFGLTWYKHRDTTQINNEISELNRFVKKLIQNSKSDKDSAHIDALRIRMDIAKSAYANAKSGWKDSSQINALKAKLIAKAQNQKVIFTEKGSMMVPKGMTESQINSLPRFSIQDGKYKSLKEAQPGIHESSQDKEGDLSTLTLNKSFKGESVETVKKFSVTESSTMLRLQLNGKVESGTITVTLTKPDGHKFKSIEIDASSDVTFEQTLLLKKNPGDWIGDWQIKVQTVKANGDYRLNILSR